jgi:hypothetical protein
LIIFRSYFVLKKSHFKNCPVNTNFFVFAFFDIMQFVCLYVIHNLVILYISFTYVYASLIPHIFASFFIMLDGIYMNKQYNTEK